MPLTRRPLSSQGDSRNVFFASVHGYGGRDPLIPPQIGGWFYPASGDSEFTRDPSDAVMGGGDDDIEEFLQSQTWTRQRRRGRCNILNCGMQLPREEDVPGMQRVGLRSTYRREIFPRLRAFDPDLIIISAGFDAHASDRYEGPPRDKSRTTFALSLTRRFVA